MADSDPRPDAETETEPGPDPDGSPEASSDVTGVIDAVVSNPFEGEWNWRAGALAGLAAAVVAGVAITVLGLDTLRVAIAGLYGFEGNLLAGWLAHLAHGVVFGLVFAFVLYDPGFYHLSDWYWKTLVVAVAYAVVLGLVGAGVIMPMWLGFLGGPIPESLPNVTAEMLTWHVLYGVVLGLVYPLVVHRFAPDHDRPATPL